MRATVKVWNFDEKPNFFRFMSLQKTCAKSARIGKWSSRPFYVTNVQAIYCAAKPILGVPVLTSWTAKTLLRKMSPKMVKPMPVLRWIPPKH